jgi:hypothetical protein
MPELQAQRRLVKSPPELWAEVSDAASLARHLGEVGEITITRVEPESTVAWEGERASGTVQLEPAGWGTRVTLTAQPSGEADAGEPAPPPPEAIAPEPEPAAPPAPEPPAEREPAPAAAETAPAECEPAAFARASRPSFLRRLLGRRAAQPTAVAAAPEPAPPAAAAEPIAAAEPPAEPALPAEPAPPAYEAAGDGLQAALTAALDSLGAAHHRPFSRG